MQDARRRATARGGIRSITIGGSVAVIGMVISVAACSAPPTIAAYNTQANGICQTYRPKLKSVDSAIALSNSRSAIQLGSVVSAALSQAQQDFPQLEALAQPTGEGAALRKAFSLENDQIQNLKRLATALKQRSGNKIQSSETALEESQAPLNQQFDVLGLTECGSGSAPVSTETR